MADFIDPAQAGQQAAPSGQFVEQQSGPRVIGEPEDNIKRQQALDPSGTEEVTEEEQAQYDDFVSRSLLLLADRRTPQGEDAQLKKSPQQTTLDLMNQSNFDVPTALAEGASRTAMLLHNMAKRAKKPYSPDVMFHAADELIAALYLLGKTAKIFEGLPGGVSIGDSKKALSKSDDGSVLDSIEFTEEELALMGQAKMIAVEKFGQMLQKSGQVGEEEQAEAMKFWQSQIEKEVESGEFDESQFEDVPVDAIRQHIGRKDVPQAQ